MESAACPMRKQRRRQQSFEKVLDSHFGVLQKTKRDNLMIEKAVKADFVMKHHRICLSVLFQKNRNLIFRPPDIKTFPDFQLFSRNVIDEHITMGYNENIKM